MRAILFLAALAGAPARPSAPPPEVRAFLQAHCVDCHDDQVRKGGLDLDSLPADFQGESLARWVLAHDRLRAGEMPPEKVKERPAPAEAAVLHDWVLREATAAETARRREHGRVPLRRLNRVEYENSVRALLGVDPELAALLPEDPLVHGFDTVAEGLRMSALHLEKFLEAADVALDAALQLGRAPERVQRRFSFKEDLSVRKNRDTPAGTITDPNSRNTHKVILGETEEGVIFFGESYPQAELRELSIKAPGRYRFRVSAAAFQSPERPVVARVYRKRSGEKRLLGWFDIPGGAGREFELTTRMQPGEKFEIGPWEVGRDAKGQTVWNAESPEAFTGAGLLLRGIEVEGPLEEAWPPASTTALLPGVEIRPLPGGKSAWVRGQQRAYELAPADPPTDLRRAVERLARLAFRRPATVEEVEPFVRLGLDGLAAGQSFEDALRVALRGVLTAPQFLLRQEAPGPLDPHALATRLALFLWSAPPDAALRARADNGTLTRPEILRTETDRLLRDPRSAAFVTHFAGQWLDLRGLDATAPDAKLYPEFDELLRESMILETEGFLRTLLEENRPAADLVDSDFLLLNRRLAEHYGIPGVVGEHLRQVPRPADSPRGGLLTQAAILKVTANGTVSSPVLRGAWVMKRLLGEPPRPPPADVGSIEPDTRGATTVREQLDKHRALESCASCHRTMDPPGFALENFDVIGGWRERYRSQEQGEKVNLRLRNNTWASYRLGPPVDASGVLADGRSFSGIRDFKALLRERHEQVARALVGKLITYATGAAVHVADRPEVERILRETASSGHGLRDLVTAVVLSEPFRSK
jgi:mono/diheme cytochrome c family protein